MQNTCNLFFALLFSFIASSASAQAPAPPKGEERGERVEALRIAYITQELNLTPEEAQQFWPIYNEFRKKLDALDGDMQRPKGQNKAAVSDKEAAEIIEKHLKRDEERVKLKREYTEKFKKVIPLQKILALHYAERGFKRQLMQRTHGGGHHHKGGGHHRGTPPAPPAPKGK